ncbi:MarR family transcriptional regulator [Bradyrhizobium sp. U87765 SZCCT0131]|uniref:MarR family winged helix-turn-helix transcriptional regulator n=1 Tax=unclassified Bradyrhizobium TaxID=2631580 RepID=UPI001BAB4593|nr:MULTISPECIES: MarR family transcriptional regulator [unclassified Bradyrhizobium]MBR1222263.1 MarR family transcriptional regulator [Bradyrhizobium sp. U87765 SZCCT0131]MBR1264253.1 MarR family transcriptional regulator [Bradyrhizobium sp. U87765 SZCCT0134]MBR1307964.1 MarR family transcriptional regulator [Bradyrhizobium sp. U87765 SZCCT0110]MBR1320503.1 MarR family transcriptional regulator [Bradyrhizobium sp. U87765 SZCCT0109]MBR1348384.1 MarR family transcriptional regulator [Bradyrhizo
MTSSFTMRAELGLLVARLARHWRRKADLALIAHGMSEAVAHPLLILSRRGKGIRQGVLADEMGIEGPSLVRLIDLLEADGLVERQEDPTDRRAKLLHLTTLGEAKADDINRVLDGVRADLLHGIPPDHIAITFETLRTIERHAVGSLDTLQLSS